LWRSIAIPASSAWVGLMSNYFCALPAYRRELQRYELDAAERAGVDALVAVYHADHRELCAHERD
jgi:heterodisulfide reductase subunit D